jgi:hypothetical protein
MIYCTVFHKGIYRLYKQGKIVHHRHGTIRVPSSGKSEQILNKRQKKMEILLPETDMIVKKMKQDSEERYPRVSYMRPEGTMEYYIQTRQANFVMRHYPRVEKK